MVHLSIGVSERAMALIMDEALLTFPQSEVEVPLKTLVTSDQTATTQLMEPVAEQQPANVHSAVVSSHESYKQIELSSMTVLTRR